MAGIATANCWGVVIVVWIAGAVYGARASHARRQGTRTGAVWQLGLFIAAVVVFHFAWHELDRVTERSTWIELPGLLLLVASSAFTIWARLRLGLMWSASPDALRADHELRTDGPYAITRHPIYTGLVGMLLGTALLNGLGVSLGFLLIGAAFLGLRIPIEERLMSKTFPDEYARSRERVPLLVPGLHLLRRSSH
jgi:protein-S-isoprenylcysteine O-methyltransferase Ste14